MDLRVKYEMNESINQSNEINMICQWEELYMLKKWIIHTHTIYIYMYAYVYTYIYIFKSYIF